MDKRTISIIGLVVIFLGAIIYFIPGSKIDLQTNLSGKSVANSNASLTDSVDSVTDSILAGAPEATSSDVIVSSGSDYNDIEPQKPLPNPPSVIKAIYATSWSAGSARKVDYLIDLIKTTELNAIVIDLKDFSGHTLYDSQLELVKKYKAKDVRIPKINALIKKLHDEGIYVIGRQTIFQDPVLAKARPDLAIQKDILDKTVEIQNSTSTSAQQAVTKRVTWYDSKGLAWIDPGAKDAWDYNIAIAKEAVSRGVDEINFDYIRFPTDGKINEMKFSHFDANNMQKVTQINNFFRYLKENTNGMNTSADLFGLVTVNNDDLGIGQNLKSAAPYFYAISPMVYPSHYAKGFIGYSNPAEHPAEVITYSMQQALKKFITEEICNDEVLVSTSTDSIATTTKKACTKKEVKYMEAKLRPWLQDFNLGAQYGVEKVRAQINAVDKILKNTPAYNGWMLWNPSNVYTKGALEL